MTSETDDSHGASFSGGFAGEVTRFNALTLENCYVYGATLSTAGNAACAPEEPVFFAGDLWNGCTIVDRTATLERAERRKELVRPLKSQEKEFENGTVAGSLGDAFAQARNYPRFKDSLADYSAVDAAIAKANALNKG